MINIKKFTFFTCLIIFLSNLTLTAKATEECFENISRSIFKFNMVVDDLIVEPIAKGYNKLPEPVKLVQEILLLIFLPCYQFLIIYYKEISVN